MNSTVPTNFVNAPSSFSSSMQGDWSGSVQKLTDSFVYGGYEKMHYGIIPNIQHTESMMSSAQSANQMINSQGNSASQVPQTPVHIEPQAVTPKDQNSQDNEDCKLLDEIMKDASYIDQQKCSCGKIMTFPMVTHNIGCCVMRIVKQDPNATTVRERYLNRELKGESTGKKAKEKSRDRCKYIANLLNREYKGGSCSESDICCVCSSHMIKPGNLPCCSSNFCRDKFRNATNYQRKKVSSTSKGEGSNLGIGDHGSPRIGGDTTGQPKKGRPRIIDTMRILKSSNQDQANAMKSVQNTVQLPQTQNTQSIASVGCLSHVSNAIDTEALSSAAVTDELAAIGGANSIATTASTISHLCSNLDITQQTPLGMVTNQHDF